MMFIIIITIILLYSDICNSAIATIETIEGKLIVFCLSEDAIIESEENGTMKEQYDKSANAIMRSCCC